MQRVDLHMHTTASDGTMTPRELMACIKAEKIVLFSVTDHDSVDSIPEMTEIAEKEGVNFIAGVELSATYLEREIHLLTYGVDVSDERLLRRVQRNSDIRETHNRAIIEYVSKRKGIVSLDGYEAFERDPSMGGWKALNYLQVSGVIDSIGDFFSIIDEMNRPLVFDDLEVVLAELSSWGYTVVLAHPPAYYPGRELSEGYLDKLRALGLSGIECFSPYYKNPDDYQYYVDYCLKNNLIMTCGSDYHGPFIPSRLLGTPPVDRKEVSYGALMKLSTEYKRIIEQFETLEAAIKMGNLNPKEAIDAILERHWVGKTGNDESLKMNLDSVESFHDYLLSRAMEAVHGEYSEVNDAELRRHLDIEKCLSKAEDSKSGAGILLFNGDGVHTLIGDIHSDQQSLSRLLDKSAFYEGIYSKPQDKWIFMGDYVDRGSQHLKTLEHLLMLKILFPSRVYLLRGNHDGGVLHEDGQLTLAYGVPEKDDPNYYFPLYMKSLVREKAISSDHLLGRYLNFFDQLPYIAFISKPTGVVECVHGGLPRPNTEDYSHLKTLSDLTEFENERECVKVNLIWSDPYRGEGDLKMSMKRFYFTEENYRAYQKRFGISYVYRGHEVVPEGVRAHFNESLFTVFSSGNTETTYYHWVKPKYVQLDKEGVSSQIEF